MAGQLVSTEAADVAVVNDYTTLAQNIAKAVYNGTDTTRLTQIDNDVMAAIDLEKQLTQVIAPVDTSSTMWIVTVTLRYAWIRHQMEASSALLALCEGDLSQRPVSAALMFSLICAWTNGWANNRDVGDLRLDRAHYDVTLMNTARQS